ncbi:MAG: NAD(+)/NADH kinase [Eubacterium sp.]|nr:NAD(+)/NADH kinase [Eubacterium sp.]
MNHFYVITNTIKDPELSVTHSIMEYLQSHGRECTLCAEGARPATNHYRYTNPDSIPADTECIIVLGGDGTLILSATDTIDRQIPLLGVNLGTLGYLAEIDRSSIFDAMDHLMKDEYQIERRMLLHGSVFRGGKQIESDIALNDVVIRKDETQGMITVKNYVNGAYLNSYKADGIIISTPTGSTGYSLSVGGPIISPRAEMFLMTPLAAHALNTRSIVLPCDESISVVIGPGRDNTTEHAAAYFDGDTKMSMLTGDRIEIRRADKDALFVKINDDSFLETLSRKMNSF